MTTTAPPSTEVGTEAHNSLVLDYIINATGLFVGHAEVPGTLIQPRPGQRDKSMRIDRLLVPTQKLVDLGWRHGIVGVEIKPSNVKLGPPLAQAMDYSRSVFTLPGGSFQVIPSWVFVFPFDKEHGPIASVMAQNRVGVATHSKWALLNLYVGEAALLRVANDHTTVRIGASPAGGKAGSR